MRRLAFILAACLFGCGGGGNVTKPGTAVFEWDVSKATRVPFRAAKIGIRTSKDYTVTIDEAAPFVVALHVEIASVEFEEAGKEVKQTAPVAIRATVKSNDAWELTGKCGDGPNYRMGPMSPSGEMVAPMGMIEDCFISYHRKSGVLFKSSYSLGKRIIISGEGTVEAFTPEEAKIE